MNTQYLKYAAEVEKTSSITKAADNLYMSQPNLSKAIKELEASVGIILFKRTPRGVVPTQKGSMFLKYAKNVLVQIEEMENLYRNDSDKKINLNILVTGSNYINNAFARYINSIGEAYEMEIHYKETGAMQAIKKITEVEYNLGIIRYRKSFEKKIIEMICNRGLSYTVMHDFRYVAVMSADSNLAGNEYVSAKDLAQKVELVQNDTDMTNILDFNVWKKAENPITTRRIYVYEEGSRLSLLTTIKDSFAISEPLPEKVLKNYNLIQLPISVKESAGRDILIHLKEYTLTEQEKIFLEILKKSMPEEVIKK